MLNYRFYLFPIASGTIFASGIRAVRHSSTYHCQEHLEFSIRILWGTEVRCFSFFFAWKDFPEHEAVFLLLCLPETFFPFCLYCLGYLSCLSSIAGYFIFLLWCIDQKFHLDVKWGRLVAFTKNNTDLAYSATLPAVLNQKRTERSLFLLRKNMSHVSRCCGLGKHPAMCICSLLVSWAKIRDED